ncbi:TetR/AcrR family transcriptional regulator [Clostridium massiliamazoniense]|uniref:TetR/AcrR family transcriptional regulator n=1 Tax=Clostridium massiliamazoniense TaxID=1347366 RepID=UPI0006D7B40C|nr:TetR/AcrR family transcriptional regulator [Clostridium massiliamazoniense]
MKCKDDNKLINIFNATLELINESGLSGTSMSKIAKRANISSSTIYVYFENKEDLLLKLYLRVKNKMNFEMYKNIDESDSFEVVYETVLKKFINFISNNKDYFLFMEQFQNSPIIQSISKEDTNEIVIPLNKLYSSGKKQGAIKDIDNNLLIIYTFYPAMQFVKDYFNGKVDLNEETIDQIVKLSWDAIKKQ